MCFKKKSKPKRVKVVLSGKKLTKEQEARRKKAIMIYTQEQETRALRKLRRRR